jgi:ribosomal protein L2
MGVRPTTRAMATNPCDHPMGGKAKKNRKSPWGKLTQGVRTRRRHKPGGGMLYLTRHAARALAAR